MLRTAFFGIICSLLAVGWQVLYGLDVNLLNKPQEIITTGEREYMFRNTVLNLVDGDPYSSSVFQYNGTIGTYFQFDFQEPILVDKVVVINGDSQASDAYTVRELTGWAIEMDGTNRQEMMKGILSLSNNRSRQEFRFDRPVRANRWAFQVASVYAPDRQSGFGRAALSEIEFWSRGEKYEVKNLSNEAQSLVDYTVSNNTELIRRHLETAVVARMTNDNILREWADKGIPADRIEIRKDKISKKIKIEWVENSNIRDLPPQSVFSGNIIALSPGTPIRITNDPIRGRKRYQFSSGVALADWCMDLWGDFWIRVGDRQWKREIGPRLSFIGTDLEGLLLTREPAMK